MKHSFRHYLRKGISGYTKWLGAQPLFARAVTTSVLISLGDIFAQWTFNKGPYNYGRTFRAATLGFCFTGPSLYVWFNLLLPRILSYRGFKNLTKMQKAFVGTFIDQTCFSWWTVGGYLFWANFLEFGDVERALNNQRAKIVKTILVCWCFWPGIIFTNLSFTPLEFQVLVINIASLAWNFFLSYRNQQPIPVSKANDKLVTGQTLQADAKMQESDVTAAKAG